MLHKLSSCIIFFVFRCLDTFSVFFAFRASNAPIILKKLLGAKTIIHHSNKSFSNNNTSTFFTLKTAITINYYFIKIEIKTNTIDNLVVIVLKFNQICGNLKGHNIFRTSPTYTFY